MTLRFIMIGGFLGAGKTTTIARLARFYTERGQRVGLVMNDQAQDLVDTTSLRCQGFAVEEVAGACFCCRFNDLVTTVGRLQMSERPDIILAEPVGSCTDLVATVVQPLRDLYGDRFEVAPYPVLFKPSHGLEILRNHGTQNTEETGFSDKAAYIFTKQLEEADAIVINRIDEIDAETLRELTELVRRAYPTTPLLQMSARTGQGFDGLTAVLDQAGDFGQRILSIDYDIYAEGEAELGWLNASVRVKAAEKFEIDTLLLRIVTSLRSAFAGTKQEVAHLKAIGLHDGIFAVVNLVSNTSDPELSLPARTQVSALDLIVNARVAADPKKLETDVRRLVTTTCQQFGANAEFISVQSFRPGRPTPTHRYALAK